MSKPGILTGVANKHAKEINEHIDALVTMVTGLQEQNAELKAENERLHSAYDKDAAVAELKQELKELRDMYACAFCITKEQQERIDAWKKEHDGEVHGIWTADDRIRAGGCCGGRYTYIFVPTSIGTSGTIRCHCGAEFEFKEIG